MPGVKTALRWTKDEALVAEAERLWSEGHSGSAIAAALGRGITRNAVISMAHRHRWSWRGVGPPPPPKPRKPRDQWGVRRSSTAIFADAQARLKRQKPPRAQHAHAQPKPEPPPVMVEDRPLRAPLPVKPALIDLRPESCRWPEGDPGTEGFHFCGEDNRPGGGTYCGAHAARAFNGRP
jgi:GcrA cell cycle regulator